MEGSEELEEGGGLMELLGSGGRLCLERDEGNLFCQLTPLSSPPPCSSASFSDSAAATTRMLCFAGAGAGAVAQKSSDSSLSTLCSSSPHSTTATSSRASKKVEAAGGKKGGGRRTTAAAAAAAASGACKKPRTEASARPGAIRVRKAKLGDRILALQQLVSPFGKTDTASVLHEALSYIQFLHDQVQVLSSPYLQRLPSSTLLHEAEEGGRRGEEPRWSDLRSRGLCLVPVSCTERVAHNRSNGADFWATAMGSTTTTTTTTQQ